MQIFEDNPQWKLTANSITVSYNIIQADGLNSDAVRAGVLNYAPLSNAPAGAAYQWPRRGFELEEVGPGVWKAKVTWAVLNYQYSLKIGGQNQQIRCNKQLQNVFVGPQAIVPSWNAGDKGRPIGWDFRTGTVQGCSIYVPTTSWTETLEIPMTDYSFHYEDAVAGVAKSPVNSKSFRGYDPGEVLFHGMQAQISQSNPDYVTASYEFEQSWNASSANGNLINIDQINGITKNGWDWLDVHYKVCKDAINPVNAPQADYVLIHRVYDQSDFAALNIGTGENLPTWQGPLKN